ncbi:hypothetical protein RUM43_007620 [Polyplax serrata]|uniref:Homeobox domain-containing protein n=1 Tax=Polyplax serrata TaxID=468196 RepID=A0AAN8S1U5_POLSC
MRIAIFVCFLLNRLHHHPPLAGQKGLKPVGRFKVMGKRTEGFALKAVRPIVWFQNRRTKWRKKHAAEMATAKRKQDEQHAEINDDLSGDEDELGRTTTAATRLRKELAEQDELARQ